MDNIYPTNPPTISQNLEASYSDIRDRQARLIDKGSCLDGLYSVSILLQYAEQLKQAHKQQVDGLKDELAEQEYQTLTLVREIKEQEKQMLTLTRELDASEKYRRLLTKAILNSNPTNLPAQ